MKVRGYAYSGGGQSVIRVDVSTDDGATWTTANLEPIQKRRYRSAVSVCMWVHHFCVMPCMEFTFYA